MTEKDVPTATPIRQMTPRKGEIPLCGEEVDFDRLYELYGRRVYSWCAYMSGSPEEAEDLTQDSFLQLFRSIDTFRGESGFVTWLYRVVNNVVQGRFRKKTVPMVAFDVFETPEGETLDRWANLEPPDHIPSDPIDRLSLERLIGQLPSSYRKILILHDIRGYRHVEIAEILAMPIGTTKAYLHRARRQLRGLYLDSLSSQNDAPACPPSARRKKLACTPTLSGV